MAGKKAVLQRMWNEISYVEIPDSYDEYPLISVIVPTLNCDESIAMSLDSLVTQKYPKIELIIVDGGSTDQTFKILEGYKGIIDQIDFVTASSLYTLMNQGLSLARGKYVNFLFPGALYLSVNTFNHVMVKAKERNWPDLVYGGTLLREKNTEPEILYHSLSSLSLKRGKQPTRLTSCWFTTSSLREIGGLEKRYEAKGEFALFCSYNSRPSYRIFHMSRILSDFTDRLPTTHILWKRFTETYKILFNSFGWRVAMGWFLTQKELAMLFEFYYHKVKSAFIIR